MPEDVAELPAMPPAPLKPPAPVTLLAVKFALAPCASPLVLGAAGKLRAGEDELDLKEEEGKRKVILNGNPLWEVKPSNGTSFPFDIDVVLLSGELIFPTYACSDVVTSYPDDEHPDNLRVSVDIDANGMSAMVTWYTARAGEKDVLTKIEVHLPDDGLVVFQ